MPVPLPCCRSCQPPKDGQALHRGDAGRYPRQEAPSEGRRVRRRRQLVAASAPGAVWESPDSLRGGRCLRQRRAARGGPGRLPCPAVVSPPPPARGLLVLESDVVARQPRPGVASVGCEDTPRETGSARRAVQACCTPVRIPLRPRRRSCWARAPRFHLCICDMTQRGGHCWSTKPETS